MRRGRISSLLQAAAALTVVVSLVTAVPVDIFSVQLFTHFRLQYFLVSLLLLAVFAVMRRPWFTAALLITALLNASYVVPWYIGEGSTGGSTRLKLVVANILSSNAEHDRLFEFLDAEQADVLVLLEVSPQWLVAFDRLRQDYPWSYAEAREGNFGIALFSRLPVKSATHIDSAPFGHPTIIATVDVGDEPVSLLATHPMIPVRKSHYEARNTQLEELAGLLDGFAGRKILAGDLNTTMWDINYRDLERATGLRNARKGFGVLPTWPTFLPVAMIPIDHVLVSNDIHVESVRKGPRIGSDHLPLVVTISL